MHIEKIHIEGILPIWNSISLNCDEQVNLFIGPNASGKSTILRAIEYVLSPKEDHPMSYVFERDGEPIPCRIEMSEDWPDDSHGLRSEALILRETTLNRVPFLYIPATRVSLPMNPAPSRLEQMLGLSLEQMKIHLEVGHLLRAGSEYESEEVQSLLKRADQIYGKVRKDYLRILFDTSDGVFYGHNFKSAIDANRALRTAGHFKQHYQRGYERAIQLGYTCAQSICPEVIHDDAPHPFLEVPEGASYQDDLIVHPSMAVGTSDVFNEVPLYLGVLSSGTQGTLLWIYALALKMAQHYGWVEGWEKEPAILLIDEIENHLHPNWQRRVIPALLEHFPKLQIFATTHSPFVVAGLKAGQVHLLSRAESGITSSTNSEDIIGWTTDEILRTFMDVSEPTDQLTVNRTRRLRELRGKESLSESEEVEMAELRRKVNEDFVSSSTPLETQRERYGDMMLRFLTSRQSELSQDGS